MAVAAAADWARMAMGKGMSFDDGPSGSGVVMAQITTADGSGSASATLPGRSVDGIDWQTTQTWSW